MQIYLSPADPAGMALKGTVAIRNENTCQNLLHRLA